MKDNHRLMSMIDTLKLELKDVRHEFDSLSNSVKMFTLDIQKLDNILNCGKSGCSNKGLRVF